MGYCVTAAVRVVKRLQCSVFLFFARAAEKEKKEDAERQAGSSGCESNPRLKMREKAEMVEWWIR